MQISWERGIRIQESKDTPEEGRELRLRRVPQRTRFRELMAREKEANKVGRSNGKGQSMLRVFSEGA